MCLLIRLWSDLKPEIWSTFNSILTTLQMIYLRFVNRVESIWQIYRKIDSYFVSLNFYYIFISLLRLRLLSICKIDFQPPHPAFISFHFFEFSFELFRIWFFMWLSVNWKERKKRLSTLKGKENPMNFKFFSPKKFTWISNFFIHIYEFLANFHDID